MKKYILTIFAACLISSCSDDDYARLNTDPIHPSEVPASLLFSNSTKALFDQMLNTSVNRNVFRLFSQYWTECQYTNETNYDIRNRALPDAHWGTFYRDILFDLQNAKKIIEETEPELPHFPQEMKNNQLAIITIIEVYAWQQLVDTFGDIPYSQALMGIENTTPAYDDAATIYADLITKIKSAHSSLDSSDGGFGSQDIVYGDNIESWKRLAATMKLKLAMRLADVNPSVSKSLAEEAVNNGVFTSNADNFSLHYEATNVNAHPLYADLVLSGRRDFVPADTYVDYLNDLEDPRRTVFFNDNLTDEDGNVIYVGGIYGALNTYVNFTGIGDPFYAPDLTGVLLSYSEVAFLLAEAVERGYAVSGTAEQHYNNAIVSNMEYWGIESSAISSYLAQPNVAYATAPGSWKEKIGKQFWIAMYDQGFEGWTAWRKYDAPQLRLPAVTGNPVPTRFTYPAEEQTLNATNYNAASTAIGGDNLNTKLFWDVN